MWYFEFSEKHKTAPNTPILKNFLIQNKKYEHDKQTYDRTSKSVKYEHMKLL
jgi:hypothetical protein